LNNLTLYWVYDNQYYVDINNNRVNIGYCKVETVQYANEVDYAIALNDCTNLKDRLNKELAFTDIKLAYKYMASQNSKINENILKAFN
jgi:hypothetical protein